MRLFAAIAGFALLLTILWDAFETIVLPRRVTRQFRLARLFYRATWLPWRALVRWLPRKKRELHLSIFGPLSLLFLLAMWAIGLIVGFALLHLGLGSRVSSPEFQAISFLTDVYLSGTTFFTLGLGDVVPRGSLARVLVVTEAGMGFGFLAVVIGYLPVIYQSFSRREVNISLLDARAGSPPSAGELLRRHSHEGGKEELCKLLADWERWSAELMESHLSYPVLCYFRSQHSNQSWLASLTTILDTCALLVASRDDICLYQGELTFAMARHAIVDLSQIFIAGPQQTGNDRLPPNELTRLRAKLAEDGFNLEFSPEADQRLLDLRQVYEPFVNPLAQYLSMDLPPFIPTGKLADNWQTTAWNGTTSLPISEARGNVRHEDHF
jgi:voltage-gated potassium channel Kch